MSDYKLSIAFGYYNRKKLFLRSLDSISRSKYAKDIEVVVVDDASDEEHRLEDIVDKYPFPINLIRTEAKDKWYINSCVPLNKAIEATKAPLIMLTNPECFHVGDVVAAAIENTTDENYIVFACYALSEESTDTFLEKKEVRITMRKSDHGMIEGWYNHSQIHPRPFHFASCITRKNMDKVGGFDEAYAHGIGWDDDDLLTTITGVVDKVVIVDNPFVLHQWHYVEGSYNHQNAANPKLEQMNRQVYLNKARQRKEASEKKHILNKTFDKVYLINLDKRKDRLEECKKIIDKSGLVVERVSAVDGSLLKEEELNRAFLDHIPEHTLRGAHGCVMSHYNVIKQAKEEGHSSILILEDDFELVSDIRIQGQVRNFTDLFKDYFGQVPEDWELLYLGANHNIHQGQTLPMIKTNVGKPVNSYTTHAYAVKESMYDKLLDIFNKDANNCPSDIGLCTLQKEMDTCYALYPSLIAQRVGYSDIMGVDADPRPYIGHY